MNNEPSPEKTRAENPTLSATGLLLRYVTDLVFAFIVFVVFLLATWGLYYLGNSLGIAWCRLSCRILGMSVISFGTLLCVLFFLKVSVKSAKKMKLQLQEPTKQVGDETSRLNPRDIAIRFGEPLSKHNRLWLFICSGIIFSVLYVGISFAGLVQSNCDELSILACELMCETGPDFTRPIDPNDLREVLEGYAEYIEEKHLSVLLSIFPSYSPKEVFSHINKTLVNAKGSQEKAANDIWQAGEKVMLFRLKTPKFLPRGRTPYEYRKAAELLLPLAEAAFIDSKEASDQFNNTPPTMENAVYSCECNRLTMLLLFPLRTSYDKPEVASLFASFREVVNECRDRKIAVAGLLSEDDPRKEFLREIIGRSEKRRLDIIDAIIENRDMDMQEVEIIEYIWDAIEISYHDRERLLQLCEKIRTAGNYTKPITP